jgi:hypothetical protein
LLVCVYLFKLLRGLSFVQEAQKPLRRDDKKILNEINKSVRYPLRTRVTTPDLKAYVLIQAAVSKIFIVDYSMRIEQMDIVEQLTRVLLALQEHCIDKGKGKLLTSSIFTRRALIQRQWENSFSNYFEQFGDISDSLKNSLNASCTSANGSRFFQDVDVSSIAEIQQRYMCSVKDANALRKRAIQGKCSTFNVVSSINGTTLCFNISPSETTSVDLTDMPFLDELRTLQLIISDEATGDLVCYRQLRPLQKYEITIPSPKIDCAKLNIQIISTEIVGVDSYCSILIEHGRIITQNAYDAATTSTGAPGATGDASIDKGKKTSNVRAKAPQPKKKKRKKAVDDSEDTGHDEDGYKYKSIRDYMVAQEGVPDISDEEKENYDPQYDNRPDAEQSRHDNRMPTELLMLRGKANEMNKSSAVQFAKHVPSFQAFAASPSPPRSRVSPPARIPAARALSERRNVGSFDRDNYSAPSANISYEHDKGKGGFFDKPIRFSEDYSPVPHTIQRNEPPSAQQNLYQVSGSSWMGPKEDQRRQEKEKTAKFEENVASSFSSIHKNADVPSNTHSNVLGLTRPYFPEKSRDDFLRSTASHSVSSTQASTSSTHAVPPSRVSLPPVVIPSVAKRYNDTKQMPPNISNQKKKDVSVTIPRTMGDPTPTAAAASISDFDDAFF